MIPVHSPVTDDSLHRITSRWYNMTISLVTSQKSEQEQLL